MGNVVNMRCARNLPQHFKGCTCVAVPGGTEVDVDLTGDLTPAQAAEIMGDDLEGEQRRAPSDPAVLVGIARDMIADPDLDYDAALEAVLPALGGQVRPSAFSDQYTYPLAAAVHEGNDEEATRIAEQILAHEARAQQVKDAPWRPAGGRLVDEDSFYGPRALGAKYDPSMSTTDVAKAIRTDIKDAKAAGWLRDDLDYRVTKHYNSVTVFVEGLSDDEQYFRDPHSAYGAGFTVPSYERLRLEEQLEWIGSSYVSAQTNSQVDYFDVSTYVSVSFQSDLGAARAEHDKQMRALAREADKATGDAATEIRAAMIGAEREFNSREREIRETDREKWGW